MGDKIGALNAPIFMPQSSPIASPKNSTVTISFIKVASYLLAAMLCIGTLVYGLLPGLLAVCLGYLLTLTILGQARLKRLRLSPAKAVAIVILVPILVLVVLLANAKGMVLGAIAQYQALLHHLAGTVLAIRQNLPVDLASNLPDELTAVQIWLAGYLKSKAHALAGFGTTGLHGFLLVYVGLVIGALMVGSQATPTQAPLRFELRQRAAHFMEAFRQIVLAQFWIATFNMLCVAVFLLLALPLFDVHMPYVASLVALTFVAGLIPIVGNLVCNSVLALAGLSVSPAVGLTCLLFLIAIHKTEYVLSARILGQQTQTATWELLAVLVVGEAVFGLPGLVAAPLYYAYLKKELQATRLV